MKRTFLLLAICALFIGCSSDYGNPVTKNYSVSGSYSGLNVSDAFNVTMSDQVSSIVITVGERAHDRLDLRVKNGYLLIGFKPGTAYVGEAKAIIPVSTLRSLNLSGASYFDGDLSGGNVDIDLSGASTYRGNVQANNIDLDLSGSSTASITGYCTSTQDIDLSGASTLNAIALDATDVRGDLSGASTADVTCCDILRVNLSGASKLTYGTVSSSCNPSVRCETSGSSTVRER
ncbi:MAG: DUF2807 domain-containing protein [Bacteroidales bacterium]|nr:DUF2807 domain-containing protein [Bacteroidales bacterium]